MGASLPDSCGVGPGLLSLKWGAEIGTFGSLISEGVIDFVAPRGKGLGTRMPGFPKKEYQGREPACVSPESDAQRRPESFSPGRSRGGIFHGSGGAGGCRGRPPPPSSVSTTLVESWVRGESAEQKEGNGGGGATPEILDWLGSSLATSVCQFFRAGGQGERPPPRA